MCADMHTCTLVHVHMVCIVCDVCAYAFSCVYVMCTLSAWMSSWVCTCGVCIHMLCVHVIVCLYVCKCVVCGYACVCMCDLSSRHDYTPYMCLRSTEDEDILLGGKQSAPMTTWQLPPCHISFVLRSGCLQVARQTPHTQRSTRVSWSLSQT